MIQLFFFSSRRRHTRYWRDWSSDVCSSDLLRDLAVLDLRARPQDLDARDAADRLRGLGDGLAHGVRVRLLGHAHQDRKSTRLNSSHANISNAVFCLIKKKNYNVSCSYVKITLHHL